MEIANSVLIKGDIDRIYRYAAEVEKWPEILPHYRSVEILEQSETDRLVSMYCVRSFGIVMFPCKWQARQELVPEKRQILFVHESGPVRGMKVAWILEQMPEGVRTSIEHHRPSSGNPLKNFYFDRVVGVLFIEAIASQTLATIKTIVEGDLKV